MSIGERISRWLDYLGITQSQLADILDVKPSAVSNWCTGLNDPASWRLAEIAEAFGMDLATFFGPVCATEDAR